MRWLMDEWMDGWVERWMKRQDFTLPQHKKVKYSLSLLFRGCDILISAVDTHCCYTQNTHNPLLPPPRIPWCIPVWSVAATGSSTTERIVHRWTMRAHSRSGSETVWTALNWLWFGCQEEFNQRSPLYLCKLPAGPGAAVNIRRSPHQWLESHKSKVQLETSQIVVVYWKRLSHAEFLKRRNSFRLLLKGQFGPGDDNPHPEAFGLKGKHEKPPLQLKSDPHFWIQVQLILSSHSPVCFGSSLNQFLGLSDSFFYSCFTFSFLFSQFVNISMKQHGCFSVVWPSGDSWLLNFELLAGLRTKSQTTATFYSTSLCLSSPVCFCWRSNTGWRLVSSSPLPVLFPVVELRLAAAQFVDASSDHMREVLPIYPQILL